MKLMHIGIKGSVVAIDRTSGKTQWNTPLKGRGFTNVSVDGNQVFAATRGEVWCLDAHSGTILWHHGLSGMGLGHVAFGNSPDQNLAVLQAQIANEQAAASGAAAG